MTGLLVETFGHGTRKVGVILDGDGRTEVVVEHLLGVDGSPELIETLFQGGTGSDVDFMTTLDQSIPTKLSVDEECTKDLD